MKIETARFGAIQVHEDQKIRFVQPIIGFPTLMEYVLVDTGGLVKWLQSLEDASVVFPVVDPFAVKQDYDIEIPMSDAYSLELKRAEEAQVWCITVLSSNPAEMRANLRAPVVLNRKTGTAKQVVLPDSSLPIRYHFEPAAIHGNKEVAHAGSYA